MTTFDYQFDYDLGSLRNTPTQRSTFLRNNQYENDVYEFDISGTRNINLSLNNISAGDDADLNLYRDSNGNGVLDFNDEYVTGSYRGENNDDSINYRASGGTYFAHVEYYNPGSNGRLDYDLDLSATHTGTASNTLATEEDFGYDLWGEQAAVEYGFVGNDNTSDAYEFSVVSGEVIDISLSGLSSDADLRVIQDSNNNNVVDEGEVYDISQNWGSSSESISVTDAGNYFVEVYQYSGNTDYQLQFDQRFV